MEEITVGPFKVSVKLNDFTISREKNSVQLVPGEVDHAINVVIHALSTEQRKVLPPFVKDFPFEIIFTGERILYLRRQEDTGNGVAWGFSEGDELIDALNAGVSKLRDVNTIMKKPGGKRHAGLQTPDPIIDGR